MLLLRPNLFLSRVKLDGIFSLHEIVHDLHVKKKNSIIPKLDFEKAYGCVCWSFLRDVLLSRGFDGAYVHRIMQLVSGGHTDVLLMVSFVLFLLMVVA